MSAVLLMCDITPDAHSMATHCQTFCQVRTILMLQFPKRYWTAEGSQRLHFTVYAEKDFSHSENNLYFTQQLS